MARFPEGAGIGRPDVVWPFRRSWFVRQVVRTVTRVCLTLLAVVAVITVLFVEALGHPEFFSIVGVLFALIPLAALVFAQTAGHRAAVAAGPGWIGVRVVRAWRTVDLRRVRAVRVADAGAFGVVASGPGALAGRFGARPGARPTIVLEDDAGHVIDIGADALDAGIGDVVRHGLGPGAVVDDEARRLLDGSPGPGDGAAPPALGPATGGDGVAPAS